VRYLVRLARQWPAVQPPQSTFLSVEVVADAHVLPVWMHVAFKWKSNWNEQGACDLLCQQCLGAISKPQQLLRLPLEHVHQFMC
jgi:hypothetical protein